eukprot:CAMPEP_0175928306 /NCGR_PEP_ID=MMETSP0108-20121206/17181_1 /TAXON_ID=195067 ORGANISM="Goniomonas pacifica, Strain CCMP1869" /NCGR_SAMPLE_ID=MMETSP0108 /ASSEMBLY_ACC=CAM_ASM_000204 /LENGTH=49 /DNA_ID=CAMNT_0017251659 /DNA_START=357 /DNA_END=506 /DNA_ORIENTATION=+
MRGCLPGNHHMPLKVPSPEVESSSQPLRNGGVTPRGHIDLLQPAVLASF